MVEIQESVVIREVWDELISSSPDLVFFEEEGYSVRNDFFDMFNIKFAEGDPLTCLENQNAVVLTESLA